ncbi:hypothetical protein RGQ29_032769 [Quercus rubra]|uniref:Uncharacterized protein n=1 Tax=Quercus rubra TaxID=3512 RepID=A0AAN7HSI4_QUERU|nr:hypothetical protein RGQ29_032769 [Quercus rubra]
MSSNRGIGKQYFTMILLMAQLSTHILQVPSFFGVKSARTTEGLILSQKNPFLISSSTCLCNLACSVGVAPGTKSMACCMSRMSGK